MSFEEWYKTRPKELDFPKGAMLIVWVQAQLNYPFPIADKAMEQEMLNDGLNKEQVDTYGAEIIDAIREAYSYEVGLRLKEKQ